MKKWLKICLVALTFLLVLSCYNYITIFNSNKKTSSAANLDTQAKNSEQAQKELAEAANLDAKAKCSEQAQKELAGFEKENINVNLHNFSQTNHYNQSMNKCFVYITYTGPIYNGNDGTYWTLKDAFENTDLAHCTYSFNANNPGAYCFILGGPAALSPEEIDNFVNQRMELNQ